MKRNIHIGTSGWQYPHWRGTFYPEEIRNADHFAYYAARFETVEINNSFYRLPTREVFERWKAAAPEGFKFAVKANRYITHMKKLHDSGEAIERMMGRASALEEKLGPILFQMPPHFGFRGDRLEAFLELLPRGYQFAFEFRNPDWYREETYRLLKRSNAAFCIYELAGHQSPLEVTADFIYIRLHGPGGKYQGDYHGNTLSMWAERCKSWSANHEIWCYFDNDEKGYAAFDALQLREMIDGKFK